MLSSPWGLWLSQMVCPRGLSVRPLQGWDRCPPAPAQVGEVCIHNHSGVYKECPAQVTHDWAVRSQCWSAVWALLC